MQLQGGTLKIIKWLWVPVAGTHQNMQGRVWPTGQVWQVRQVKKIIEFHVVLCNFHKKCTMTCLESVALDMS